MNQYYLKSNQFSYRSQSCSQGTFLQFQKLRLYYFCYQYDINYLPSNIKQNVYLLHSGSKSFDIFCFCHIKNSSFNSCIKISTTSIYINTVFLINLNTCTCSCTLKCNVLIKIEYRMIPGQSSANFFNKSALMSVAITFAPSLAKAWNTQ